MMKEIVIQGIDPISGRRKVNAMWLITPDFFFLAWRGCEVLTENSFSILNP